MSSPTTCVGRCSTGATRPPGEPKEECQIVALRPDLCPGWETYVNRHRDGTVFHTLAWRDSVRDTFGHEDVYLVAMRHGRIVGVFPLFLVASRVAGRMLVSVPYAVGGGTLADDIEATSELFETAKSLAEERDCKAIDLRSERAVIPDISTNDRYVGFRRDLPERSEDVLAWLPRKARAAARNGRIKYQLRVSVGDEHLREVWCLYTISMRRLGSLAYPYRFFQRLVEATPDRHWVSLVRWDDRPVAGLVTFLFRDTVMPYFIGTTESARECSAANFIYLTVMERAIEQGYRIFDFGRSRRENSGSYNFKRFNGFEPRPLGYQVYAAPGAAVPDLSPDSRKFQFARRLWPYLPLWLTRVVGAHVARHIPG